MCQPPPVITNVKHSGPDRPPAGIEISLTCYKKHFDFGPDSEFWNWRRFPNKSWVFSAYKQLVTCACTDQFHIVSTVFIRLCWIYGVTVTISCSVRNTGTCRRLWGVQRQFEREPRKNWAASRSIGTSAGIPWMPSTSTGVIQKGNRAVQKRTGGRIIASGRVGWKKKTLCLMLLAYMKLTRKSNKLLFLC